MEKTNKKKRKLEKSKKSLKKSSPKHEKLVKKSVKLKVAPEEKQASKDVSIKKKKKKIKTQLLESRTNLNGKQSVTKEDESLPSSNKKITEQKTEPPKLENNLIINILDNTEDYPDFDSFQRVSADKKEGDTSRHKKPKLEKKMPILLNDVKENEDSSEYDSSKVLFDDDDENACEGPTHIIAMDCEMVGVGNRGKKSILARVAVVNEFGKCVYDQFVKPTEPVTDYRTHISGIRARDIHYGKVFEEVQKEVKALLKGRLLVGHALWNDMRVLSINHPSKYTRDTARYGHFLRLGSGRSPPLHILTKQLLGVEIQKGEHNPTQDAQAALKLYLLHKDQWERGLRYKKIKKKEKTEKIAAARRQAMA